MKKFLLIASIILVIFACNRFEHNFEPDYIAPVAKIWVDSNQGYAPFEVSFRDSSNVGSKSLISWQWDFDSDGTIDSEEQNSIYVFSEVGEFFAKLTIFDGENARDISLNHTFKTNPTLISAGYSSSSGDNRVALNMVQQQFEKYDFNVDRVEYSSTMYGMFELIATEVRTETNRAILRNDTVSALFNSTEMEYASVSKVSIDEEMTNLIRYQTAYGAAAKVITTIDQMMQTLLGIKQ